VHEKPATQGLSPYGPTTNPAADNLARIAHVVPTVTAHPQDLLREAFSKDPSLAGAYTSVVQARRAGGPPMPNALSMPHTGVAAFARARESRRLAAACTVSTKRNRPPVETRHGCEPLRSQPRRSQNRSTVTCRSAAVSKVLSPLGSDAVRAPGSLSGQTSQVVDIKPKSS